MNISELKEKISRLSTPLIADSCVRLSLPIRLAPHGIRPVFAGRFVAGNVLPVQHYGSVDIFLEAMENANKGDVLVIDNKCRKDEGCIGDLIAIEAKSCCLAGIVLWGCNRDTAEIKEIGFPVFSYGTCPVGPMRHDKRDPDALSAAYIGDLKITKKDYLFADDDGVIFVPADRLEDIVLTAYTIYEAERQIANNVKAGNTLREQFKFSEYISKRASDSSYTFRMHIKSLGGAIEE